VVDIEEIGGDNTQKRQKSALFMRPRCALILRI